MLDTDAQNKRDAVAGAAGEAQYCEDCRFCRPQIVLGPVSFGMEFATCLATPRERMQPPWHYFVVRKVSKPAPQEYQYCDLVRKNNPRLEVCPNYQAKKSPALPASMDPPSERPANQKGNL